MAENTNGDLSNLKNTLQFNTLSLGFLKNWIFLLTKSAIGKMAKTLGRGLPHLFGQFLKENIFFRGPFPIFDK